MKRSAGPALAILATLVMTTLAPTRAFAADGLSLAAGYDYTIGKYGGTAATEIRYLPLVMSYASAAGTYKITVPQIEVTRRAAGGTETVVPGDADNGAIILPVSSVAQRVSGLGDILAAASYNISDDHSSGVVIDVTGKIKFATADQKKGLGTGKNDYALQVDLAKLIGPASLLGMLGYRVVGKPDGVDLHNTFYASIGCATSLAGGTTIGLAADFREASFATNAPSRELTAYAVSRLAQDWKLQAYVLVGMSHASADWGAGGMLTYQFR